MNLKRVETFEELLSLLPSVAQLHSELDGFWEPDLSREEFVAELTNKFNASNFFFADVENGKLVYFVVVLRDTNERCFFWLFYMNKDHRHLTRDLLAQLKQLVKNLGFLVCDFSTTRLTKSYDRWVRKFGAQPHTLNYRIIL